MNEKADGKASVSDEQPFNSSGVFPASSTPEVVCVGVTKDEQGTNSAGTIGNTRQNFPNLSDFISKNKYQQVEYIYKSSLR